MTPSRTKLPIASLGNEPDAIDFSILAELTRNDKNVMRKFALKFMTSAREGMDEIESAMERRDMKAIRTLGHFNKSPAKMIGALEFSDLCQELEEQGNDGGSLEQISLIVSRMQVLLERIDKQVLDELGDS